MCEEYHYDNTRFSEKLRIELCGAKNVAYQQCFSKYTFVRTKENALQLEFYPFSRLFFCEQQEKDRWKEADTYTAPTWYWRLDVTYQYLETYQNGKWLMENQVSRPLMLKTYLRWSHKLPNSKLIFKNCRIKAYFDALIYNLLSFKTFSPFLNVCTVWLYTLSQCIGEQTQLGSHIIIHSRSYAPGFCPKLKLISSWALEHPNPNHTFLHCGKILCGDSFVGSVRDLITSLKYTLPYFSVELYPALIHCCGIVYLNTLLEYSQY